MTNGNGDSLVDFNALKAHLNDNFLAYGQLRDSSGERNVEYESYQRVADDQTQQIETQLVALDGLVIELDVMLAEMQAAAPSEIKNVRLHQTSRLTLPAEGFNVVPPAPAPVNPLPPAPTEAP